MPYVSVVPYHEAKGPLKEIYDEYLAARGRIGNVMAVNSLRPRTLRALQDLNDAVTKDSTSGLTEAEKQMIATLVSAINKYQY
jgi:alkylhydroperoxidase family enzyme